MIAGFKAAVTKRVNVVRRMSGCPVWQGRFYEHIIRNEADLHRIRTYIQDNPLQWALDEDDPMNINE